MNTSVTFGFFAALAFLKLGQAVGFPHEGKRLVKVSEDDPGSWLSLEEMVELKRTHVNGLDVTDDLNWTKTAVVPNEDRVPEELFYETVVNNFIAKLDLDRTITFLLHFVDHFQRQAFTQEGRKAALWLFSEIENDITNSKYKGAANVSLFEHPSVGTQPSVIVRIEGANRTMRAEVVILGSHLDSINYDVHSPAPGSIDNGSGCAAMLEALRVLLFSGFIPKRTVEFQFYAFGELGLYGSGDIVRKYNSDKVDIVSMMNFDEVGFLTVGNGVGINIDYTNYELNNFVRWLVYKYLNLKWFNTNCGYACSDHVSFDRLGYITASPSEHLTARDIRHTESDTPEKVSFEQIMEFSKLALGYAVEMAQPHSD